MSKKKKQESEFWKKVHFKYRLSAINENTLEEVWKIKASIFSGAILFMVIAFLLISITAIIIITTPIRYYLPGYLDVEIRDKAIKSAIQLDSLEQALKFQDAYVLNVKKVLSGALAVDSVAIVDSAFVAEDDPILEKSEREKEFTTKFEEDQRYNLGVFPANVINSGGLFYKPIRGVVVERFNANKKRYQVVFKTAKSETVLASLEGTVIYAGFDVEKKYIIQIQHKNGYISIYKGCKQLVKKVGDKVRTGEAIGVVESDSEEGTLAFELWDKGLPVDPANYITF